MSADQGEEEEAGHQNMFPQHHIDFIKVTKGCNAGQKMKNETSATLSETSRKLVDDFATGSATISKLKISHL